MCLSIYVCVSQFYGQLQVGWNEKMYYVAHFHLSISSFLVTDLMSLRLKCLYYCFVCLLVTVIVPSGCKPNNVSSSCLCPLWVALCIWAKTSSCTHSLFTDAVAPWLLKDNLMLPTWSCLHIHFMLSCVAPPVCRWGWTKNLIRSEILHP